MDQATVIARRQGRAGRITLNRPGALNAIDTRMVQEIAQALEWWRDDPAVHLVIIDAAGERAFCSGGDVRSLRSAILGGNAGPVDAFFLQEYALNRHIARYPKPYVALIDGIWMGGGVGLAVHGSARVVSEHAQFAMPEVQLGLFTDVGASYVLPRLRGHWGMYLGLTGTRVGAADACWLGLATHHMSRAGMAALGDALAADGMAALAEGVTALPPGPLRARAEVVEAVFSKETLPEIMASLEQVGEEWAGEALSAMRTGSPASLRWTFELIRDGAERSLEQCLRAELLAAQVATRHPDFVEGVRAALVDKDRAPRWQAPPG